MKMRGVLYRQLIDKELIRKWLPELTPREGKVLSLIYGLGCNGHTLEEVAAIYDVTRERVVQIKHKALRKIAAGEPLHNGK